MYFITGVYSSPSNPHVAHVSTRKEFYSPLFFLTKIKLLLFKAHLPFPFSIKKLFQLYQIAFRTTANLEKNFKGMKGKILDLLCYVTTYFKIIEIKQLNRVVTSTQLK